MRTTGLLLILIFGFVMACSPSAEVAKPAPAEVKPTFSFRLHLETTNTDGVPDSLIQSVRGKNDVVIMDTVVHVDELDLNKIEFKKETAETKKVIFYFNKEGAGKIAKLVKKRKKPMAVVVMNGEVYEVLNLNNAYKSGVLRLSKSILVSDADKLAATMPKKLLAP